MENIIQSLFTLGCKARKVSFWNPFNVKTVGLWRVQTWERTEKVITKSSMLRICDGAPAWSVVKLLCANCATVFLWGDRWCPVKCYPWRGVPLKTATKCCLTLVATDLLKCNQWDNSCRGGREWWKKSVPEFHKLYSTTLKTHHDHRKSHVWRNVRSQMGLPELCI